MIELKPPPHAVSDDLLLVVHHRVCAYAAVSVANLEARISYYATHLALLGASIDDTERDEVRASLAEAREDLLQAHYVWAQAYRMVQILTATTGGAAVPPGSVSTDPYHREMLRSYGMAQSDPDPFEGL